MDSIKLSVRSLVEFVLRQGSIDSRFAGFDRANEGARIHRKLQKEAGAQYTPEVTFKAMRVVDDITYHLEGRADGIIAEPEGMVVDEIKTTTISTDYLTADFNPLHWAQAQCYGAFLCERDSLKSVTVQLTYYQVYTGEIIRHRRRFTAEELEQFLFDALHRYTPWAHMEENWRAQRNASLRQLAFPFPSYRNGQYQLARAVYLTVVRQGRLFATAPTGVGKTVSTLFPALKAMGEGHGERIFYLTAKTITRSVAEETFAAMRRTAMPNAPLRLKTLTLTAKDKICPLKHRNCTPEACPYADGYYDRINDAVYRLLQQQDDFTPQELTRFGEQEKLCPFELALDLSNWCDCIVCDYNYLFDPVVSLKRFFAEGGDFIFLVDEAHNLVDRARAMYSATLTKSAFVQVRKQLKKIPRTFAKAIAAVSGAFKNLSDENEPFRKNYAYPDKLPKLALALERFSAQARDWLEENHEGEAHDALLQLYFDVHFYLKIYAMYDEHYTTLFSFYKNDVEVQLLCLDASQFLDDTLALGRAGVLFSATLSPVDYFIQTLGGGTQAKRIGVKSPFPQEHLCLLVADTISTKYADRANTARDVCRYIEAAVRAKQGNYMVFFSSYQYLHEIQEQFQTLYPHIQLAVQNAGFTEEERTAFLQQFTAQNNDTLVGFCVLGGVFSEGVDLMGDRLIGSIVVGVGLPQIGTERDALRQYYQTLNGEGFSYAYQYPGMNKVLQAAGRVIRTPQDKGMVLLIDDRYAQASYRRLFPPHWSHAQTVSSPEDMSDKLQKFWNF